MSTCQTHENVNLLELVSVLRPVLPIFGDSAAMMLVMIAVDLAGIYSEP